MFQNDVEDDIANIAAAVEDLFQQFVEVLQNDYADGAMVPGIKVAKDFEHELVRLSLDLLEDIVLRLGFFEVHALSQLLYDGHHRLAGLLKHLHLRSEER